MEYDEVGNLLSLLISDNDIYYINKQQKKYNIKNKTLYDKTINVGDSLTMYQMYIINSKYDRSVGRLNRECSKCKYNLINFLVLSENNKCIYICNNCNNITF